MMKFVPVAACGLVACAAINNFDAKPVSVDPVSGARSCMTMGNTFTVYGFEGTDGQRYELRPGPSPMPAPNSPVIVEIDGRVVATGVEGIAITPELRAAMDDGRRIDVTRTGVSGRVHRLGQPLDDFIWCLG